MQDRLRRLDALFAERVLGCKVEWLDRYVRGQQPFCTCEPSAGEYPHGEWSDRSIRDEDRELMPYTRSLDAAWEGAVRTGKAFGVEYMDLPQFTGCQANLGSQNSYVMEWSAAAADPAEALVLACLRAVGCSEEELR